MTRRNGRRSAKRGNHRQPRQPSTHGPRIQASTRPLTLMLWSATGILVASIDAFGNAHHCSPVAMHGGMLYRKLENGSGRKNIAHYWASSIIVQREGCA